MKKQERQSLLKIIELAKNCNLLFGDFLFHLAKIHESEPNSVKQLHWQEQSEAILENLMFHQTMLAAAFEPFEKEISIAMFEKRLDNDFPIYKKYEKQVDKTEKVAAQDLEEIISELENDIEESETESELPDYEIMFKTADDVLEYLNEKEEKNDPLLKFNFIGKSDDQSEHKEILDEIRSRLSGNPPSLPPVSDDFSELEKQRIINEAVRLIKQIQAIIRKHGLYYDARKRLWKRPKQNNKEK